MGHGAEVPHVVVAPVLSLRDLGLVVAVEGEDVHDLPHVGRSAERLTAQSAAINVDEQIDFDPLLAQVAGQVAHQPRAVAEPHKREPGVRLAFVDRGDLLGVVEGVERQAVIRLDVAERVEVLLQPRHVSDVERIDAVQEEDVDAVLAAGGQLEGVAHLLGG